MLRTSVALIALFAVPAATRPLTPAEISQVDQLVAKTLADTGVPSTEIAIVRDGRLVLEKAYGKANEGLPTPDGWVLDRDGGPSNDPLVGVARLPVGRSTTSSGRTRSAPSPRSTTVPGRRSPPT